MIFTTLDTAQLTLPYITALFPALPFAFPFPRTSPPELYSRSAVEVLDEV